MRNKVMSKVLAWRTYVVVGSIFKGVMIQKPVKEAFLIGEIPRAG